MHVMDLDNEKLMTRYLLGELSLADRALVEERLASDPLYFEALCALEDELILKWHRGELSDDERRLFTLAYLSSPARRARVESTRAVIDVADKSPARLDSIWDEIRRWLLTTRPVPRFAIAALAAILAATGGVAAYRMNLVTSQLKRWERENVELRQQTGAAHRLAVAFTLAPVGERSQAATERTNVVRVPPQAAEVWLQFQIDDPGTSTEFEAVLDPLDRTNGTKPRPARVEPVAGAALVTVTLAPADLPDGDYVLRLQRAAAMPGASPDIVATRTLRVTHE